MRIGEVVDAAGTPTGSRVVTRVRDGSLYAYVVTGRRPTDPPADPRVVGPLAPALMVPAPPAATGQADLVPPPADAAAAPGLDRVVFAHADGLICADPHGLVCWQTPIRQAVACVFGVDGRVLWVYQRDGAGGGALSAVDPSTGTVIATARSAAATATTTGGRATARLLVHPDGVHLLLSVHSGPQRSTVSRARLTDGRIEVADYSTLHRRWLLDIAPDGGTFLTVGADRRDVARHRFTDGAALVRVPAAMFGWDTDADQAALTLDGGYLDGETAIVSVTGDVGNGMEWEFRHFVDLRTGTDGGRLPAPPTPLHDAFEIRPLGDGSWLSVDHEQRVWRNLK
ncbi:hypothetical protein [Micromonospora sp. NBC_01813]|uniref:hypothetical protein n=1 Tax=Micromonospora sp. NBC_01813 TaxID=2975988 RepID=UPI002DDC20BC|nr:hypothetical protein [Micromonospora sp. NBC_01813]WSA06220.1 hypothetical protein OG958_17970 [Micromonospora sp. NBC_01813]